MDNKLKWTGIILGVLAGVWLLASVEGVYYYQNFNKVKDTLQFQKKIETLSMDTSSVIGKLDYYVKELAENDSVSHGAFGFCLATADSGKIILQHNSDKSLIPASSLKIVTTGVALDMIGAGYSIPTYLQYSGTINKATHTLHGNIYIRGSGDPSLGSNNFGANTYKLTLQRWMTAIHSLGIDTIKGAIVGDGDIFDYDAVPGGWAWEDAELDYGAAPSGLNFRDNCYDINVSISANGYAYAYVDPPVPGMKTSNTVMYNPFILNSYAYAAGPPFTSERLLRGEVKYGGTYIAPVSDPAYFCAYSLYKFLRKNGISVSDSATTVRRLRIDGNNLQPERSSIFTTYSPSLGSIIYYTNHVSQNMYAETILKLISVLKNSYGSTAGGIRAVYNYWKDKNIDLRGFYICDGSGLSRANNVTAKQLAFFLVSYANDSTIFRTFYTSLPVYGASLVAGGQDEPIAKLNIHAKGGYMSRVRSLAGYVKSKSGKLMSFSMIANNQEFIWFNMVARMEKILKLMTELE